MFFCVVAVTWEFLYKITIITKLAVFICLMILFERFIYPVTICNFIAETFCNHFQLIVSDECVSF